MVPVFVLNRTEYFVKNLLGLLSLTIRVSLYTIRRLYFVFPKAWQAKQQMGKSIITVIILLLRLSSAVGEEDLLFSALKKRLIEDGVDAKLVTTVYENPAVSLEPSILAVNLQRSEKTFEFGQYLTEASMAKAKDYLDVHWQTLAKAQDDFGIPPSIIVAILMVETRLRSYQGKHLTVNVLSTMAAANDPLVEQQVLLSLPPGSTDPTGQGSVKTILKKRSGRGYRELKAFLNYTVENGLDPVSFKESTEGAIGLPQFLPSSISAYGRDGDGDGVVNLITNEDAIASVANFLKEHHWPQAKDPTAEKRALFSYNKSTYYVDAVYSLAQRLQ